MIRTVVDASTVVAYLLGEAVPIEREALLGDPHAPAFLDIEVTQVLRSLTHAGQVDGERAQIARAELRELTLRRHADASLLEGAWRLRDRCTTYDGMYVALAQGLDATLITRDARLARGAAEIVEIRTAA
ncbi:MAG: type II toxin-antitoxin system VapC family toxin [Patulibacter sp.]